MSALLLLVIVLVVVVAVTLGVDVRRRRRTRGLPQGSSSPSQVRHDAQDLSKRLGSDGPNVNGGF